MTRSFRWTIVVPLTVLILVTSIIMTMLWQYWYEIDMEEAYRDQWIANLGNVEYLNTEAEVQRYLTNISKKYADEDVIINIYDRDLQVVWEAKPQNHKQLEQQFIAFSDYLSDFMRNNSNEHMFFKKKSMKDHKEHLMVIYRLSFDVPQFILVSYPMEEMIDNKLNQKFLLLVIIMIVFTLLGVIVGFFIWRDISNPLKKITSIAGKVTEGQFEHRVYVNRKDEFDLLATTLNRMIQAIREKVTELSDEKSKLEGVLNNMLSGVILINQKGQVRYTNPSAERILVASKESLISRHYSDVLGPYGLQEFIEDALQRGEFYRDQIKIQTSILRVVEVSIVPIRNINRLIHSVIVVIHDISDIKRLEQIRAEFVANVSHELKTPITSIKGFAETIIDGVIDDKDTTLEFTNIIYKESDRLSKLVHDLLELSKIESSVYAIEKHNEDLVQIASDVIKNLGNEATKSGKSLKFESNKEKIFHFVNRDRMKQVFINLISNALTYSKENSTVYTRINEFDNWIVLEVEDNGIGIPEKDLPRIFERFYRVHKDRSRASGGTGLGLSIVKHIVDIHNGNLEVESKVGVGTTFRITFTK
ncbi:hypothetical protein BHU72_09630 [Desulfuribacillus stibiiarsenatis]|uniref:histidine kinase n=1 Tax=Desulfuribacillus stibiiarsenatis TaxID=1390249 RepID=A0A1E5L2U8_9FIRM|nr:HAMP domain-containing histidine kinase [Desulfuribacillus stibiiarsenatis]OEH84458.1 hypothetical protein BHU72_09630 [Desulfuribacillus stibiiarsenatis]